MANAVEELPPVGFEDFLHREAGATRRHELVGGRVHVVAGGSERHELAAGLVYEALAPGARASGCRPFIANRLLRAGGSAAYYPDVLVVCGPARHRLYEDDAAVVEVLSPTTADVDRREKAAAYAQLPSLQAYVLVEPDRRRIEVATSVGDGLRWDAYGSGATVLLPVGVLDVDALYDALERAATTE